MSDHTYIVSLRIQTDRPLTDDEQREIGDANDEFESIVGGMLADIPDLRVFAVEASGPDEVTS